MDTDNIDKRKRHQNEIKGTMNFRSKLTDVPFKDPLVDSIIKVMANFMMNLYYPIIQ